MLNHAFFISAPPAPANVTFVFVAAGNYASYALDVNGKAWAAGNNYLGDGTGNACCCWVKVCCDYSYKKIAGAFQHVLALRCDGKLVAWGNNWLGQLGDCSTTTRNSPVLVCSSDTFIDIGACYTASAALRDDGIAFMWGGNYRGVLGDGTTTDRCAPTAVCCNCVYTKLATSGLHTFGLKTNGQAMAWGDNSTGALGNGSTTDLCQPTAVCCNCQYTCILAGSSSSPHSFGILTNGKIVSWGNGYAGLNGDGAYNNYCVPTAISCDYEYCDIATGYGHKLAIRTNGMLYAWGNNNQGELGTNDWGNTLVPWPVVGTCVWKSIDANIQSIGSTDTCNIYAWGNNSYGSYGNGTTTTCYCPTISCPLA